ncbi:MAG TPA: DUF4126 domain-containing protein [Solirubrobacterales bacterium]|nr:DUF4126 domain-containing protein [Solirubrobacterales bacterium]
MDLGATLLSTGWASGVNAYATLALLGILGRAGVGEVPEQLQSDPVIALSAVMFVIEFVTDKVPLLDSAWDVVHTAVRPAIGGAIGAIFGTDADLSGLEEVGAAGGTGTVALASHAVKAGIRLGINTSPEPASNIFVSLAEDATVALMVVFALEEPVLAATVAVVLLLAVGAIVIFAAKRIRRGAARLREWRARRSGRAPPG